MRRSRLSHNNPLSVCTRLFVVLDPMQVIPVPRSGDNSHTGNRAHSCQIVSVVISSCLDLDSYFRYDTDGGGEISFDELVERVCSAGHVTGGGVTHLAPPYDALRTIDMPPN